MNHSLIEMLGNVSTNNLENDFNAISEKLLNHSILVIDNKEYRITEIEFYWNPNMIDPNAKEDNFAYYKRATKGLQTNIGNWCIHASGVDITIGAKNQVCGGILLRAACPLANNEDKIQKEDIYGPIVLRNLMFRASDYQKLKAEINGNLPAKALPSIVEKECLSNEKVFQSSRVGLSNKDGHDKPYRYLIFPKKRHYGKTTIAGYLQTNYNYTSDALKRVFGYKIL